MRSRVGSVSLPWRNSERNRAYPRRAAGEPARRPRKVGSCPPEERAPRSTATEPSGAVRSSWIWNLLIGTFMADRQWLVGRGGGLGPSAPLLFLFAYSS